MHDLVVEFDGRNVVITDDNNRLVAYRQQGREAVSVEQLVRLAEAVDLVVSTLGGRVMEVRRVRDRQAAEKTEKHRGAKTERRGDGVETAKRARGSKDRSGNRPGPAPTQQHLFGRPDRHRG